MHRDRVQIGLISPVFLAIVVCIAQSDRRPQFSEYKTLRDDVDENEASRTENPSEVKIFFVDDELLTDQNVNLDDEGNASEETHESSSEEYDDLFAIEDIEDIEPVFYTVTEYFDLFPYSLYVIFEFIKSNAERNESNLILDPLFTM